MKENITFAEDKKKAEALRALAQEDERSLGYIMRKATKEYLHKASGFNKPTMRKAKGFNKPKTLATV